MAAGKKCRAIRNACTPCLLALPLFSQLVYFVFCPIYNTLPRSGLDGQACRVLRKETKDAREMKDARCPQNAPDKCWLFLEKTLGDQLVAHRL